MKFWTIQSIGAWNHALSIGYLVGNRNYVSDEFLSSYQWMINHLKKRLPHYSGEFPVWLWTKRPDLRTSGKLEKGQRGVLLEVELNDYEVLISDFMAWHIVLSNHFLALTEEEENEYHKDLLSITKEESWKRIFDYKMIKQFEYWEGVEVLQAVSDRIDIKRIRLIREFISR
ncbi:DUF3841 domain-containing protein [Cohnella boryungensis]|uniref:DUF3841 domain-containing protein n=1 Tax=Cohnella boryungensis TaxID=768479 RepID=A0ABV8SHK4_9BACL